MSTQMSKLVGYDSGDESASETVAFMVQQNEGEEVCSKEKSLEDEWDSFSQMISGNASDNKEMLVSYPARSLQVTSDPSPGLNDVIIRTKQLTDTKSDTSKSDMLYDPLNQNSSDEDGNKDEILNTLNLPTKEQNKERFFKEEIAEQEKITNPPRSSKDSKLPERRDECSDDKVHKRSRRDSSSNESASPKSKKSKVSPQHKKSTRNRSRSRERSKERSRRRHDSRERSSSRSRHKHRSSKNARRSRSRSKQHNRRRYDRHRSRSRSDSSSHHRHRRTKQASKNTGSAKVSNPKNFKEQLKAMFLQTQNQTAEEIEREIHLDDKNLLTANEKKSFLPLNNSNPLAAMVAGSSKTTPQQALAQTMAAMHAKVQEITGVAVPKYYNPSAINPIKYAEQLKKRKLLWSKSKEVDKDKEVDVKTQAQWSNTSFVSDQDGKMAAKFRKLMGIKEDERLAAMARDEDLSKLTEEQRKKQEELFQQLAREYDFARMTTHTCRGVGLGFTSHNLSQS